MGGWRDIYDSIAPKPRIFSSEKNARGHGLLPEGIFGPRTKKSEVEWAILSYTARQPPIFAIYAPPCVTCHIFTLTIM